MFKPSAYIGLKYLKLEYSSKMPPNVAKRKSKKSIQVVAVVTPEGIQGNFNPEPRKPLIAHLDIHSNEVVFRDQITKYDPSPPIQPEPYDPSADNIFANTQGTIDIISDEKVDTVGEVESTIKYEDVQTNLSTHESRPLQVFSKCDLLVEFATASATKQLPASTTVACYWCSHTFANQPCIIPLSERHGVYKVYGNFCCPECSIAYLLQEHIDPHVRWERMALLYRIYDTSAEGRIYPAPPREVLQLFGGPLSIESYRATIAGHKIRVDLHIPPIVSIIGSIDTKPIDFYDTSIKNNIVLLPYDKMQKAEEGLRLKRSKPLKDKESTLDACMNIQIKNTKNIKN